MIKKKKKTLKKDKGGDFSNPEHNTLNSYSYIKIYPFQIYVYQKYLKKKNLFFPKTKMKKKIKND